MTTARESLSKLVLVPALVTLGVTLLRLVGEFQGWAPALFSREGGGGGALIGIVWLVPLFGAWFGAQLVADPARPTPGRLALVGLGALILTVGGSVAVVMVVQPEVLGRIAVFLAFSLAAGVLVYRAWPRLGAVLLVYGLAARLPVVLVMLAAILGEWGTHYDAPPPEFPAMGPWAKWFLIGVLPQLMLWVPFTLYVGALGAAAGLAWALRRGR
jgi:hypothetical protein